MQKKYIVQMSADKIFTYSVELKSVKEYESPHNGREKEVVVMSFL